MNLFLKTIITSSLLLGSSFLFAQTTESIFLDRLHTFNADVISIQSDFEQTRSLAIMEEPLISTGKFYYKKPGLMKWDQQLPTPYYFIINGDNVIRFDGKERKVMSSNSPQIVHFKNFILGTIDGSMFESDDYAALFTRSGNLIKIELLPQKKSLARKIDRIELEFGYKKMMLKKLVITEVGGDKMSIVFTNQQVNTIENNTLFN